MICQNETTTLQLTPLENKIENVPVNSTNETKNDSEKKILTDITKTKWIRHCPNCSINLHYTTRTAWNKANKKESVCYKCGTNKAVLTKGFDVDIRLHRMCPQCNQTTFHKNVEQRRYAESQNKSCKFCGNEKRKESILKNWKGKLSFANYNPKACQYFDRLNQEKRWNLQHALNGGEVRVLNYCLDAFDKSNNIVVEYDEPYHYNRQGELKIKHRLRQNRIINHLKCRFYRFNERKTNVGHIFRPEPTRLKIR